MMITSSDHHNFQTSTLKENDMLKTKLFIGSEIPPVSNLELINTKLINI